MNDADLPEKVAKRFRRVRDLYDDETDALAASFHIECRDLTSKCGKLLRNIPALELGDAALIYDALTALDAKLSSIAERT